MLDLSRVSDESLLRYYEAIRVQVSADIRSGYRFLGEAARDHANVLLTEIHRRGLSVTPIYWPDR